MNKRQLRELLKLAMDALGRQARGNVNLANDVACLKRELHEAKEKIKRRGTKIGNDADRLAFDELYDHRHMLFLNLVAYRGGWISRLNPDGTSRDGWFIAGVTLPTGDITYHLPMRLWDTSCMFLEERERAPRWDGHTSADVLMRLYHNIWTGEK